MSTHWMDIQTNTFQRWCNKYLKRRGMHVDSLEFDLKDGIKLANLVEIISGDRSVGKLNKHPRVPAQKLENVSMTLQFLYAEKIKLVNIGPEDIVDGRLKLILGLIWTLILRYQIQKGQKTEEVSTTESDLLKWVNSKIGPDYEVKNFRGDWNDGKALCALVDALRPGSIDHAGLDPSQKEQNCCLGIDKAFDTMDIAPLLLGNELANPKVDKLSVITYISQFRDIPEQIAVIDNSLMYAAQSFAYGPGLQEGVENTAGTFTVETTTDEDVGELKVQVFGPSSTAVASITESTEGKYEVEYTPTEVGEYEIHVTLEDHHIPGSIFKVTILEEESLGGEGKFRVFYSTTSSSGKGRSDVRDLQKLLTDKKIHERPDFEPWIPVDLMERDDREALFRKAGTRALPIVIIDDVVVGDHDAIVALNESGVLDKILVKGIMGAGKEFLKDKIVVAPEEQ